MGRLREADPGTVSERRLDVAVATLQSAEARVAAAEAGVQQAIEQMGGDDDQDNAKLKSALAAVDKAELDLANTTVVASIDGVVTDLRVDVGAFAGTGHPVLTLISTHDVWISADFTENNLGRLREGSSVDIVFDAKPGRVYSGRVRSIGLGVGSGPVSPPGVLPTIDNDRDWLRQAQRFPVIIEFDAEQDGGLRSSLRIGGQATVMAYADGAGPLKLLGKVYIRLASLLTYAY